MPWIQLKIDSSKEQASQVSELLSDAGAVAVSLEDAADEPLFEPPPGATPLWQKTRVTALFEDTVDADNLASDLQTKLALQIPLNYSIEHLEDQDWERAWMDDFKPMAFGKRLWICPSWHTPPDKDAVNIFLDPGLAFGSGTHPTTALCLEWLEGCPLQDKDLIDYGCGSGILAIAGLKLGAQHAWGVDNDPQALKASQVNAEKNSVKERLITYLPEQMPDIEADVLVANILANPLIELRDKLAHLVRPGGHIALSGILEEQQEQVMQAYSEHFQMAPATIKEGWVRLEGRRN